MSSNGSDDKLLVKDPVLEKLADALLAEVAEKDSKVLSRLDKLDELGGHQAVVNLLARVEQHGREHYRDRKPFVFDKTEAKAFTPSPFETPRRNFAAAMGLGALATAAVFFAETKVPGEDADKDKDEFSWPTSAKVGTALSLIVAYVSAWTAADQINTGIEAYRQAVKENKDTTSIVRYLYKKINESRVERIQVPQEQDAIKETPGIPMMMEHTRQSRGL